MTTYWQKNLTAIKQLHPALFSQIVDYEYKPVGDILDTPAGLPTLRFFADGGGGPLAYNAQNPWQDAAVHLETVEKEARGLALFVGLGLGYGPLRLVAERPALGMMVIIEPSLDLFVTALHHVDFGPLLLSSKVRFMIGDIDLAALEQMVGRIASLEDTHILRHVPSFQWRQEVYTPLSHQVFLVVNQLNASGGTTRKAGLRFFRNRLANLSQLCNSHDLGTMKDRFAGKPAVLAATGPSLDRSMADLKKVAGRCVLFAVDSALAPLLKSGIMPDFVTSIDFQDLNFEKLAPFVSEQWPFPLIAAVKVTPLITKRFKARRLFWAFNEDIPQQWVHDALGVQELVPFAFSVAHLSLGAALCMGCDPIIFIGQDLGYTTGQGDHAGGTIIMQQGLPTDRELFQVPGVDGGQVATDRGLLTLQKRFEDIIAAHPDRKYFNATVAGAHIQGTGPAALTDLAEKFMGADLQVQAIVDQAVATGPSFPVDAFIRRTQQTSQEISKLERQLREAIGLSKEAQREIARLQKKRLPIHAFETLPAGLAKKLSKFHRLNRTVDSAQTLSEHVLELTFPVLSANDSKREQNEEINKQQGYLPWLLAEIERIDLVNRERARAYGLYRGQLEYIAERLAMENKDLPPLTAATSSRYFAKARFYAAGGEYHLVRELAARLLANEADCVEALLLAGEAEAGLLDFQKANSFWQAAIGKAPERATEVRALRWQQAEHWIALAEQHGNAGEAGGDQFPQLLPTWLKRVAAILEHEEMVPDMLQLLWKKHAVRMEEWLGVGETDSVSLTLQGWEHFGERFPEVLVFKARLAAAKGYTKEALAIMEMVISQKPHQPQWLALMARMLLEGGYFEQGIARLREAAALDPATAVLWDELGDVLAAQGDAEGAAMAYEQCYLALPNRLDVLRKMGDCYLAANQPEAAMAAYQAVLAQNPGHAGAEQGMVAARRNEKQDREGR